MRKIILMISTSLDGFFEDEDRGIDWHRVDEELHQHFNDRTRAVSAFLEGRITYELMAEFWPTADQDPSCSPVMAEFARLWRDMPKFVFSRTMEKADWNTTVMHDVVAEEIRALQEQPGGDMVVGGPDLAASFLRLGLIDEFHLYVHPVVLGRGRPLFPPSDLTPMALRHTGTRSFGNGVVLLRYERADATG
ncbi:dihydrofolate reductase family protein [Streptomyces sp. NPDC059166]|uniref:dihydrofolate reductase family protein n=1 Tax=Streptomyces sp. NPDC059166 TaxID=3346752 RepID=UPI0036CFDBE7